MNKHEMDFVLYEYVLGRFDFYIRWCKLEAVFKRHGISEYGEVIR